MNRDIFISYADEDIEQANELCVHLEALGTLCFLAKRDVRYGDWAQRASSAIANAKLSIIMLSNAANNSDFVKREVMLSVYRKKVLLPIFLEDVAPKEGLDVYMIDAQWIVAYNEPYKSDRRRLAAFVAQCLTDLATEQDRDLKEEAKPESIAQPEGTIKPKIGDVRVLSPSPEIEANSSTELPIIELRDRKLSPVPTAIATQSDPVESLVYLPDRGHLISGGWDGSIVFRDVRRRKVLSKLIGHSGATQSSHVVSDLAWDGSGHVYSSDWEGNIKVWDPTRMAQVKTLPGTGSGTNAIAVSRKSGRILTGDANKCLRILDIEAGDLIHTLPIPAGAVKAVTMTRDGSTGFSGSTDGLRIWDLNSHREIAHLTNAGAVFSMALAPQEELLLTGSFDGSIRIWKLKDGELVTEVKPHDDIVRSVSFSPDGLRFISGSYDKTSHVCSVRKGTTLAILKKHNLAVTRTLFGETSDIAITADAEGMIYMWTLV
ncbi:MAG TPA: TIR domain-containing protein [Fimbriimonadaceae bacterium]|jgi:WD40 repeat protein